MNGIRSLWEQLLPCFADENEGQYDFAEVSTFSSSYRLRLEDPPVLGHRFSSSRSSSLCLVVKANSPPGSPGEIQREFAPLASALPPPMAPRVCVLDPGSGESCNALQGMVHLHLAVSPEYDLQVKRYPPGWKSMTGVKLTEREVEAASKVVSTGVRSAWPSFEDLRGPAHPRNLATWASVIFDAERNQLRSVDLSSTGCDRWAARGIAAISRPTSDFECLICGSRGGEVLSDSVARRGCKL